MGSFNLLTLKDTTLKRYPFIPLTRYGLINPPLWLIAFSLLVVWSADALAQGAAEWARRRTPVVEVFEAAKDAVVNISSTQVLEVRSSVGIDRLFEEMFALPPRTKQLKRTSVGSGFVLHPAGYIVTNAHVVARTAQQKAIFADQSEYDAQLIAVDQERDLAILKIDPPHPLTPLKLGHSHDLMIGETAIAIGNPLGYQHTVTAGVVSALDRTLEFDNNLSFQGLIQTDASINPGNSGGPLLNVNSELIGINTAIRGDAQNIGFAIPVDQLRALLPALLDVERRYRIVTGLAVSGEEPCRIRAVTKGSPAHRAGLEPGDTITHIDNVPIASGIDFHIALIGRVPREAVIMNYTRGVTAATAELTLDPRPQPDGDKLLQDRLGIYAQTLTPDVAKAMRLGGVTGLVLTDVDWRSPAGKAKLKRGDVLVSINRYRVSNMGEVGELLEKVRQGVVLRLTLLRVTGLGVYRLTVDLEAR